MIVTSYYDIYNKPERLIQYSSWFSDLANSGLEIILFTDPSLVKEFQTLPKTVKVIGLSLDECELYSLANNYKGDLPSTRNIEKDTKEYLALINTKIEFIKKSTEICFDTNLIWLDFGILKVMNNKQQVISKIKEITLKEHTKIIIPGCWNFKNFSSDAVCWRFCGGLLILPRKDVDWFYDKSKEMLISFCTESDKKLVWEVNLWTAIEIIDKEERINWYYGDHNDSMIMNFDNYQ